MATWPMRPRSSESRVGKEACTPRAALGSALPAGSPPALLSPNRATGCGLRAVAPAERAVRRLVPLVVGPARPNSVENQVYQGASRTALRSSMPAESPAAQLRYRPEAGFCPSPREPAERRVSWEAPMAMGLAKPSSPENQVFQEVSALSASLPCSSLASYHSRPAAVCELPPLEPEERRVRREVPLAVVLERRGSPESRMCQEVNTLSTARTCSSSTGCLGVQPGSGAAVVPPLRGLRQVACPGSIFAHVSPRLDSELPQPVRTLRGTPVPRLDLVAAPGVYVAREPSGRATGTSDAAVA